ncbi:adenosylcobinamide-GDP ribazoletransferase [Cognatishimia sp. SS12]|uniref:adenosylcobinamide-GDP ribazoletransferase n=1 Tax=Cognatishimia sp. SS12 TaxID=2979465 RepID=UPI00232B4DB4|nr:adenosylcobinamide-GDP ribazoletransferase [Cognatishimia sp. SS12]MDC0739644.1 adenosylcobinamide-GDP ribazoletransferase [Cognatishimia sp. SS12]
MAEKDETSLVQFADVATALALLTRLPLKAKFHRSACASWAYPCAGLAVAALAGLAACVALWLGLAPAMAAAAYIGAGLLVTGALHEDGLADCADGFWGGWDRDRRLEIMKDSQIGSYGVLALILGVGLRWLAVTELVQSGGWIWTLLAIEALSRAVLPALMHALPHARNSGLSHAQGRPPLSSAALAVVWPSLLAFLLCGWGGLGWALLAILAASAVGFLAQRKIDGQTGDVLGAAQQVALILMLIAAT